MSVTRYSINGGLHENPAGSFVRYEDYAKLDELLNKMFGSLYLREFRIMNGLGTNVPKVTVVTEAASERQG